MSGKSAFGADGLILNKTRVTSDRYRVVSGSMGNHGDSHDSPNHAYHVAMGNWAPGGFHGTMSISYALGLDHFPKEAKRNLIVFLRVQGYDAWLRKHGS